MCQFLLLNINVHLFTCSAFGLKRCEPFVVIFFVAWQRKYPFLYKLSNEWFDFQPYLKSVFAHSCQVVEYYILRWWQENFSCYSHFQILLRCSPKILATFLYVNAELIKVATGPQIDSLKTFQWQKEDAIKAAHFWKLWSDEACNGNEVIQMLLPKVYYQRVQIMKLSVCVLISQLGDIFQLTG